MKLNAAARKRIPRGEFGVPSKAPGSGSYPMPDESHARDAVARASGKPVVAQVLAKAKRLFPNIQWEAGAKKAKRSKIAAIRAGA